ncbi:alpha/beta hydrolase [Microbaculum marinum]|uniref:Alpha/beta hydrolase n=1 Tax=Microbaculum marinum TaxID=1764581 RepID=A0AAW9RXD1_9HYPH
MSRIAWADLNGVALRYAATGASGPTVVLIHEMGGSLESWDGVVAQLPGDIRTLRHDLRGSGMSEKIQGCADVEALAADIAGLLDLEAVAGPVVLAGCAAGAAVAMCFAARYPARTAGVIGLAPAVGVQAAFRAERLEGLKSVETHGQRSIEQDMLARAWPDVLRLRDPDVFAAYRARWIAADPYGFAALSRMLFDLTFNDYLPQIRCPALMVAGEHDPLRPPDHVAELSTHIRGCRFRSVDSGHFMNVQSPELVAGLIAGFLRDNGLA